MYARHRLMVIHPFAQYDMPILKQREVTGRTESAHTDKQAKGFQYNP